MIHIHMQDIEVEGDYLERKAGDGRDSKEEGGRYEQVLWYMHLKMSG